MSEIVKICKIHGDLEKDKVILEKNSKSKSGYRIRCYQCRVEKDRKWKINNWKKHKESASRKRNNDRKLYREGLIDTLPKADIWAKQDRINNPEKYKKWAKISRDRLGDTRNINERCRKFKLNTNFYYDLLKSQDNKCAICKNPEKRRVRSSLKICNLSIDHHHASGKIRELLCHNCNQVIGHSKENVEILKAAIAYLEKHKCDS